MTFVVVHTDGRTYKKTPVKSFTEGRDDDAWGKAYDMKDELMKERKDCGWYDVWEVEDGRTP